MGLAGYWHLFMKPFYEPFFVLKYVVFFFVVNFFQ